MTVPHKRPEAYLAEVFGFPADNRDADIEYFRTLGLCPFRPIHPLAKRDLSLLDSSVPFQQQFDRCTKGKKKDPLGVCSVYVQGRPCITCPVRFGEDEVMLDATKTWAGSVLGVPAVELKAIPEVRLIPTPLPETGARAGGSLFDGQGSPPLEETGLADGDPAAEGAQDPASADKQDAQQEKSAGNIDYVLAHIDTAVKNSAHLSDYHLNGYAALEVQAVYISGNVRNPFEDYMGRVPWDGINPPRPDWLSSSRKRLVPQLAWKGSVLRAWEKPIAVCVQGAFWETMPYLSAVTTGKTTGAAYQEMAWVIVDLERQGRIYQLQHVQTTYSEFARALLAATQTPAGYDHVLQKMVLKKYVKQATGKAPPLPKVSGAAKRTGAARSARKPRS